MFILSDFESVVSQDSVPFRTNLGTLSRPQTPQNCGARNDQGDFCLVSSHFDSQGMQSTWKVSPRDRSML